MGKRAECDRPEIVYLADDAVHGGSGGRMETETEIGERGKRDGGSEERSWVEFCFGRSVDATMGFVRLLES